LNQPLVDDPSVPARSWPRPAVSRVAARCRRRARISTTGPAPR